MEHPPIGPFMPVAPIAQAPFIMPPAPVLAPQVSVYDYHQSIYVAPFVRFDDTAIILVLFILLVIITRSAILGHKC